MSVRDATVDVGSPDANVVPAPVDGCALRLSNYAARARVDYDPALYPATFTYEAWASFDSFAVTDPAQIIFTASQPGFRLIYMQAYRENIDCVMGTGAFDPRVSYSILRAGILPGTFHHYACTHDESALTLWIDGVPVASRSGAGYQPPTTSPFGIGGNGYPNGGGFGGEIPDHDIIGSIDEFRISNTVVYTERFTPARELDVRADTVALWRFNECSGTTSRNEVEGGTLALTLDNDATWVETQ